MLGLAVVVRVGDLLKLGHTLALQLPHHMRHGDAWEGHVVPARRPRVIAVEAAHIGVEIVRARTLGTVGTRARDDGQIRRVGAEPGLGVLGVEADLHGLADLFGGEQQVVLDLGFGQAQVAHAVVAHVGGRVAVQAVIDEQFGAALQRGHVRHLLLGELAPLNAAARGLRGTNQAQRDQQEGNQLFHGCSCSAGSVGVEGHTFGRRH
mmetsp:Transcript_21066/g.81671  ORF Transcript_21066/g.81671 Transcript_21066/m.81671 type:complete len:207 (+) Transcript_21066:1837-2457(+)